MTQKDQISQKIEKNRERLEFLLKKRENLTNEITQLERKIANQEHALLNLKN